MYNNVLHGRYLVARYDPTVVDYKAAEPETVLIDIDATPFDEADRWRSHDAFGWTAGPLAQYLSTGDPNSDLPVSPQKRDYWSLLKQRNSTIGTHLNPLGATAVAELMLQAYTLTLAHLHVFFATPLLSPAPAIESFVQLASGRSRPEPMARYIMQRGAHYRLEPQT
jgi:hypothetical protein